MCYRETVDEEEESSSVHASNIPFFYRIYYIFHKYYGYERTNHSTCFSEYYEVDGSNGGYSNG